MEDARRAWQERAQTDALFAIESSRRDWTLDDFFDHGRATVRVALERFGERLQRGRLLEIGCGVGRTAIPFAGAFESVDAVDVAPAMVERARTLGPPPNLRFHVTDGESLAPFEDASFDAVFSEHVFQHVPHRPVVERYLAEVARVLRPGGSALLQFDTRPGGRARWLGLVPDRLLPRTHRRFMRRYRHDPDWIRRTAAQNGMAVEREIDEEPGRHWFLLRTAAPSR